METTETAQSGLRVGERGAAFAIITYEFLR